MAYDLGVDLGTAYTCAVVWRGGRTEVVQLGGTSNLIPSVLSVREDGTVLSGETAERRTVTDPARTVREFKRRFGDDAPYVIGGVPYGAEALVGHLLAAVVAAVTQVEGGPPDRIALTHPADYGPFKLDLLTHAAHLAGVDQPVLVAEPVAAAIAYAEREGLAVGQHLLVYDLGGGTFDAAVVRIDSGGPVVVGTPEGLARLGGIDFDQAVIAHVEAATGGAVTALDSTDPGARAALARLRADCRAAKEALSHDTETEIPVLLPQVRTSVRLTREELEAMVGPRLTDTAHVLERVVTSAGLTMSDIAAVLLVGGSSQMPAVAQLVRQHTGRPVAVDANPKTTVAAGAAVLAASRATSGIGSGPTAPAPAAPTAPTVPAPAAAPPPAAPPRPAPPPAVTPSPAPIPPAPPTVAPTPVAARAESPRRSKKGLVIAAVALVAVLAVVGGIVATSGGGDEQPGPGDAATTSTTLAQGTVWADAVAPSGVYRTLLDQLPVMFAAEATCRPIDDADPDPLGIYPQGPDEASIECTYARDATVVFSLFATEQAMADFFEGRLQGREMTHGQGRIGTAPPWELDYTGDPERGSGSIFGYQRQGEGQRSEIGWIRAGTRTYAYSYALGDDYAAYYRWWAETFGGPAPPA